MGAYIAKTALPRVGAGPTVAARPGIAAESPSRARRAARVSKWALFLSALGPGVVGLMANNDAGGMLSYLETGAGRGLGWILPALAVLGVPALFVQWTAYRVARATDLPYGEVLVRGAGRPLAVIEATVLYGLGALWLVTEFLGMTQALALAGMPLQVSAPATFGLVVAMTSSRVYPRIERLVLWTTLASVAFIPALLLVHHAGGAVAAAFGRPRENPWFLILALAGNSTAPWLIYWQQNAVRAGEERAPSQRMWDMTTGVVSYVGMAAAVILLGAVAPGRASRLASASPLLWLYREGGHVAGTLFAVGIFDAGLVAACALSLSSLWTLREALGHGAKEQAEAPNRGPWFGVHVATLGAAAAVVLVPRLPAGPLALWTQAVTGMWMPVTLALLGVVVGSRRIMGRHVLKPVEQAAIWATAAGFATLAVLGLAGAIGG